MSYLLTEAMLLRTIRFRETSAILELFSADHGKIKFMAKGVFGKRTRYGLELLAPMDLVFRFARYSELNHLKELTPKGFIPTQSDPLRVNACICLAAELLNKLLPLHHPDTETFQLAKEFSRMVRTTEKPTQTTLFFTIKLLAKLGFSAKHHPQSAQTHDSLIDQILHSDWKTLETFALPKPQRMKLFAHAKSLIAHVAEKPLRSEPFFRQVCML